MTHKLSRRSNKRLWSHYQKNAFTSFKAYRADKGKTHLIINQFMFGITAALFPGDKNCCFLRLKITALPIVTWSI